MPYLPGLDGMRALAVVSVMVWHAGHAWLSGGFLGVEVFFVISGYLITLLLIAEHERSDSISLRAFWGRRFRRLLPALYLTLIGITVYCALFLKNPLGKLRGDVVAAVFYVSNWFQIWSGKGYTDQSDFVPLRHLWSLAVEEQFYLIWPLVMILILRRGRNRLPQIGLWLVGVAFLIMVVTALFFHNAFYLNPVENPSAYFKAFGRELDKNNFLYLSTISRSSGILLGAGFAMVWRPMAVMRGPLKNKARSLDLAAVIGLAGLAGLIFFYELVGAENGRYFAPLFRGGFFLTGLCTLMVIAAVTHSGTIIGKFLGNPVLNWIGTRSYGLYLFHWPIYQIIRKAAGVALKPGQFVLAMVITVAITEASYRFLETPIRKREFVAKFRSPRPQVLAGLAVVGILIGFGGVSLSTAAVKCTNDLECQLEANAHSVVTLPTATGTTLPGTATTLPGSGSTVASTGATDATATTVPGESTTVVSTTTTVPTKPKIDVLMIGESVMKGAAAKLTAQGFLVDAEENRGGKAVVALLKTYVAANDISNVVIQSGTNGPVTQAEYDEMMTEVATVPHVFMMTVKAPKDWIGPNNEKINALPATHPNVTIIDWQVKGQLIEDQLSSKDGGVHLNTARAVTFYTNMVLTALGRPNIVGTAATGG